MLTQLSISNFKAFSKKHDLNLSPITLIYGPNSSGKSSIIQSLMLLKQSLSSPGEYGGLVSHGELVDLGTYSSMVNGHDVDHNIGFSVEFNAPENLKRAVGHYSMFGRKHKRRATLDYQIFSDSQKCKNTFTFLTSANFSVYLADKAKKSIPYKFGFSSKLNDPISLKDNANLVELSRQFELDSEESLKDFVRLLNSRSNSSDNKTRTALNNLIFSSDVGFSTPSSVKVKDEKGGAELHSYTLEYAMANAIVGSFSTELHEKFRDITYLGPLRSYPSRLYAPNGDVSGGVGKLGEHAAYLLHEKPSICESINHWFEEFQIPYILSTENIGNDVTGTVISIQLKDTRTGVTVGPSDVGFGIGQLLPILVEGLVRNDCTICVEQPEIHLHPKLQANLADFFIDTVNPEDERRNQWLVETHSESLILRLQKRVREKRIDPSDISIIYVEPTTKGASVLHLQLDEDGDFIDEWPDGFFDDRLDEIFGS